MTRAWTGHTVDAATGYRTYKYMPDYHDASTLHAVRQAGAVGRAVGPHRGRSRAARPSECSRFITAKLFSHFAYPVVAR